MEAVLATAIVVVHPVVRVVPEMRCGGQNVDMAAGYIYIYICAPPTGSGHAT